MADGLLLVLSGQYFCDLSWPDVLCVARYWQLDVNKVPMPNEKEVWDRSVYEASEEYKGRMVGCMTGLMLCCCI